MDGPSDPGEACTFECDSGANAEAMDLTVYVFTDNKSPNDQNCGRAIKTNFRTSFNPVPQWLDDPTWYDNEGEEEFMSSEVKDDLRLKSYEL